MHVPMISRSKLRRRSLLKHLRESSTAKDTLIEGATQIENCSAHQGYRESNEAIRVGLHCYNSTC